MTTTPRAVTMAAISNTRAQVFIASICWVTSSVNSPNTLNSSRGREGCQSTLGKNSRRLPGCRRTMLSWRRAWCAFICAGSWSRMLGPPALVSLTTGAWCRHHFESWAPGCSGNVRFRHPQHSIICRPWAIGRCQVAGGSALGLARLLYTLEAAEEDGTRESCRFSPEVLDAVARALRWTRQGSSMCRHDLARFAGSGCSARSAAWLARTRIETGRTPM